MTIECFKEMQNDAISLGPSDFFSDTAVVDAFIDNIEPPRLPVISSNTRVGRHPLLSPPRSRPSAGGMPKIQPYTVVSRGDGRLVGIVSTLNETVYTTTRIDKQVDISLNLTAANYLRQAIAQLMSEHPTCNIIVYLSDDDRESTLKIAREVQFFDVAISGLQSKDALVVSSSSAASLNSTSTTTLLEPATVEHLQHASGGYVHGQQRQGHGRRHDFV